MNQLPLSQVDLSIIIVSWNVADILQECLDSIFAPSHTVSPLESLTLEVIVVDSASTDHTVEMIQQNFPQVILLAQNENVGFTKGNNIGFKTATGRHLFLLNPDTIVLGDALKEMVVYLDNNLDVGIIGPFTFNVDGTYQSTRRRFPTIAIGYFESTWLQPFAPNQLLQHYYVMDAPITATLDVDWVQGSGLMARREVYEQIGGLDEGYIMYSEELDWCKRAKLQGWRVIFLCTAQIIHHGGKSTEQVSARKHIYFQESKLRYFRKYHGENVAKRLRLFLLTGYYWQIFIEGIKWFLRSKPELRRQRIHDYQEVIRSGLKVT